MQRSQTARLLAKAQLIDNRTVDELTIEAWHEVMADVDYDDAMEALSVHRRTSTDWVMPAHIVTGVKAIRKARLNTGTAIDGIPDADPDDVVAYLDALRARRLRIASGQDETPRPVAALIAQAEPKRVPHA